MNSVARIESVCTFKRGVKYLMYSISLIKQSNLFLHFFLVLYFETAKEVFRHCARVIVIIMFPHRG